KTGRDQFCHPLHPKEVFRASQRFIPPRTNNAFLLPRCYCCANNIYNVCQCVCAKGSPLFISRGLLR
ncbi:hypothetical protein BDR03DRAFT_964266, partial [Suillus americanus]